MKMMRLGVGILALVPQVGIAACTGSSQQAQGLNAIFSGGNDVCQTSGAGTLTGQLGIIIDTLFIVAGAIAVLIMVIGGIRYIASTGDAKRVQAAKDTIFYAVIGLVVVILARAIVGYVIGTIAP